MPKKPIVYGSIKDKRTAPELLNERKHRKFNEEEMENFIYGKEFNVERRKWVTLRDSDPELGSSHKFYEMDTDDPQASLDALGSAVADGSMTMSDAIDTVDVSAVLIEPVSGRLVSET